MKKIFLLVLFIPNFILAQSFVPNAPELDLKSYILIEPSTNTVIAEFNSNELIEPASMTKVMTGYVVADQIQNGLISLDDQVLISEKAWKMEGSKMFIEAGKKVSILDLLKGIIIQSGNDASVAIAEYVGGGWHIADAVQRSYDVEGMHVGTVAAGRIGIDMLRKMKPFDVHLHYFDIHKLPDEVEAELNLTYHESVESLVAVCDVVNISCPLHPKTEHLFNDEMIGKMKRGAYIVNTARGKICDKDAIARGLESGQLSGYAGDVWFPQPAPNDHVWRTMPNHGMTPHTSGTSLSAQARYAAGVREILECFFEDKPIREPYLIVQNGDLAGMGAHSYTKGTATDGSEEAAEFKK